MDVFLYCVMLFCLKVPFPAITAVFRKSWVGSEVAGMKITFFAIFDPTWAHILAPKRPKNGIPEAEFEFSVS